MNRLRRLRWRLVDALRGFASRWFLLRLASWLDDRHPDWCWAWLCHDWGLGYDLHHPCEFDGGAEPCRREARVMGHCWCGKFTCTDGQEVRVSMRGEDISR